MPQNKTTFASILFTLIVFFLVIDILKKRKTYMCQQVFSLRKIMFTRGQYEHCLRSEHQRKSSLT